MTQTGITTNDPSSTKTSWFFDLLSLLIENSIKECCRYGLNDRARSQSMVDHGHDLFAAASHCSIARAESEAVSYS